MYNSIHSLFFLTKVTILYLHETLDALTQAISILESSLITPQTPFLMHYANESGSNLPLYNPQEILAVNGQIEQNLAHLQHSRAARERSALEN